MIDLFLERDFDHPVTPADLAADMQIGAGCADLYRVTWCGSLLGVDGRKLVCQFRAPDAESVRITLRTFNADTRRLWRGTVHDAPGLTHFGPASANVMVRRRFAAPVQLADLQAIEDAGAACLETRHVKFVRTYFSADHLRMLCLYRAPDAESVREAQRYAGMPVEDVWAFNAMLPE